MAERRPPDAFDRYARATEPDPITVARVTAGAAARRGRLGVPVRAGMLSAALLLGAGGGLLAVDLPRPPSPPAVPSPDRGGSGIEGPTESRALPARVAPAPEPRLVALQRSRRAPAVGARTAAPPPSTTSAPLAEAPPIGVETEVPPAVQADTVEDEALGPDERDAAALDAAISRSERDRAARRPARWTLRAAGTFVPETIPSARLEAGVEAATPIAPYARVTVGAPRKLTDVDVWLWDAGAVAGVQVRRGWFVGGGGAELLWWQVADRPTGAPGLAGRVDLGVAPGGGSWRVDASGSWSALRVVLEHDGASEPLPPWRVDLGISHTW